MTMNGALRIAACAAVTVLGREPATAVQVPDSTAIASLVAAQVRAEHLVYGLPNEAGFDARQVQVETLTTLRGHASGDVLVRRASAWTLEHWHPYIVAVVGQRTLRLGGFPAPELREAAELLGEHPASTGGARKLSEVLATLADPNGAQDLLFQEDSARTAAARAILAKWRNVQPTTWPADTIAGVFGQGTVAIRLTVLSEAHHVLGRPWQPITYGFEFDSNGRLVSWAMHEGEYLR